MKKISMMFAVSLSLSVSALAQGRQSVRVVLDSRVSQSDGELAQVLVNSLYLAGIGARVERNELGTIETTFIGIDQVDCIYEGLVDLESHPSKTLLNTNYTCRENDSRSPHNKLSPGASFHIMKAVEEVVKAKSDLVGAASFFAENVSCQGTWNAFPIDQGGSREYTCAFDVLVDYEAE